jgi:hypothetical protein
MSIKPKINIDELYETKQKNDLNKLELYNKLLLKIHTKIKTASRQRNSSNFCSFIMPELLIGFPNYNYSECLVFIVDSLETNGFLTRYIHPNLLFISWNHWIPKYVRDEYKKKTGIEIDSLGDTLQKDKSIVRFNETKKEVKNVPEFKSSGRFVYDDILLNSINEKFNN